MQALIISILVTILAAITYSADDKCPAIYQRFSETHTYCKGKNPNCDIKISGVGKGHIKFILEFHNNLRERLASGELKQGDDTFPMSGNTLLMEWDKELAEIAQKHANQCEVKYDCPTCRESKNFEVVGQNILQNTTKTENTLKADWNNTLSTWEKEKDDFNLTNICEYAEDKGSQNFTQMIWANSWKIGCGYVLYKEEGDVKKRFYVCNYGPGGNIEKENVYGILKRKEFPTCPDDSDEGNRNYPHLCSVYPNKRPLFTDPYPNYLYCRFENKSECPFVSPKGQKKWNITHTLSGSSVGIVLKEKEKSTINFTTPIRMKTDFCIEFDYVIGANSYGDIPANALEVRILDPNKRVVDVYHIGSFMYEHDTTHFIRYTSYYRITNVTISIIFEVLREGDPDQYIEISNLIAGSCRYPDGCYS